MKLDGQAELAAPRSAVWALLADPRRVAQLLPGVESVEPAGPDQYRVRLRYALGPVAGLYTGLVTLLEQQPPQRLRLRVQLQGGPGFVGGEGTLELAEADGRTAVRYQAEFRMGGMLAAVGQRLAVGAARKTIEEFFQAAEQALASAQ